MPISFGLDLSSNYITSNEINKILQKDTCSTNNLWNNVFEKIKHCICSTKKEQALAYFQELCHPYEPLTMDRVEDIFFSLKNLASPAYKNRFCSDHIDNGGFLKLHIRDDKGDILFISRERDRNQGYYCVMGHTFNIMGSLPKALKSYPTYSLEMKKTSHRTPNMAIVLGFTIHHNNTGTKITKNFQEVTEFLNNEKKQGSLDKWMKQEQTTYISSVINKEIDNACTKMGMKINNKVKESIFSSIIFEAGIQHIKTDIVCAQSSIKNLICNSILNDQKINNFFSVILLNDRNKLINEIKDEVSNMVYHSLFNEDIEKIGTLSADKIMSHLQFKKKFSYA